MTGYSVSSLIITSLAWTVLIMVDAVRIAPPKLSRFEIIRRRQSGDPEAHQLEQEQVAYPRLRTLQSMIETILLVIASALSIMTFGWLVGTLAAAVLGTQRHMIVRTPWLQRFVQSRYDAWHNAITRYVLGWKWLDWLSNYTETAERSVSSKAELVQVARASRTLTSDEIKWLESLTLFGDKKVRDVMTPASVMDTIDVEDHLGPLVLDSLHKTGHSRFPVTQGDIHHVVGMLYLHDIIDLKSDQASVRSAMDPRVVYIRESHGLSQALHAFLRTHRHLFVVVNEFRETVGLLSLEDVIEALVGHKIVDEFDRFDDLRAVAAHNPRGNNSPTDRTDV